MGYLFGLRTRQRRRPLTTSGNIRRAGQPRSRFDAHLRSGATTEGLRRLAGLRDKKVWREDKSGHETAIRAQPLWRHSGTLAHASQILSGGRFTAVHRPLGDRPLVIDAGMHHVTGDGRNSLRRQHRGVRVGASSGLEELGYPRLSLFGRQISPPLRPVSSRLERRVESALTTPGVRG